MVGSRKAAKSYGDASQQGIGTHELDDGSGVRVVSGHQEAAVG
jgi:hypothetical protein